MVLPASATRIAARNLVHLPIPFERVTFRSGEAMWPHFNPFHCRLFFTKTTFNRASNVNEDVANDRATLIAHVPDHVGSIVCVLRYTAEVSWDSILEDRYVTPRKASMLDSKTRACQRNLIILGIGNPLEIIGIVRWRGVVGRAHVIVSLHIAGQSSFSLGKSHSDIFMILSTSAAHADGDRIYIYSVRHACDQVFTFGSLSFLGVDETQRREMACQANQSARIVG